jgi:hypothetical protein
MFQEVGIDVRWRDPMVGRDLRVGMVLGIATATARRPGRPVGVDGTYTVEERPPAGRQGAFSAADGIAMTEVKLITLDPGHFHAALVQKESYPGVSHRVHVYAPLGSDLFAHLGHIAGFNDSRR